MRKNKVYAGLLSCFILSSATVTAQASVYAFSFGYSQFGEADWVFNGQFDSTKAKSGSGTLQFFPIEAEGPPFSESVSGVDMTISRSIGVEGSSVLKVDADFSSGFPLEDIASYFYETPTGYRFDSVDTNFNIYDSSLSLIGPSTVPLPASASMFGAALMALGAVGYGVKRKKASAAA